MLLLFNLLDLHELVVDHFVGVLKDPLPDLPCVDLLALLSNFGGVFALLLIGLGPLLHRYHFFVLTLRLNVSFVLFALHDIELSLLLLDLPLKVGLLLCLLLLELGSVVVLLFKLLHHLNFRSFHALQLLLHRLRLHFLRVQGLGQLRLLPLLLL